MEKKIQLIFCLALGENWCENHGSYKLLQNHKFLPTSGVAIKFTKNNGLKQNFKCEFKRGCDVTLCIINMVY